jgi:hypothetical protein
MQHPDDALLAVIAHVHEVFGCGAGELKTEPRDIVYNYFTGWFLLDLISSIPATLLAVHSAPIQPLRSKFVAS